MFSHSCAPLKGGKGLFLIDGSVRGVFFLVQSLGDVLILVREVDSLQLFLLHYGVFHKWRAWASGDGIVWMKWWHTYAGRKIWK